VWYSPTADQNQHDGEESVHHGVVGALNVIFAIPKKGGELQAMKSQNEL
jgi:hypothetical protein